MFLAGAVYVRAPINLELILLTFFMTLPINFIIYGLNDIYDYESDKRNKRKNLLFGIILKKEYHSLVLKSIIILSILVLIISFLFLKLITSLLLISMILLALFYSVPPFRFKTKTPLDVIVNGLGYFLPFVLGYTLIKPISSIPNEILYFPVLIMGGYIYSTIMDYREDKQAGHKTFAVRFSKRTAAITSMIIFLLVFVSSNFQTEIINIFLRIGIIMTLFSSIFPNEILAKKMFIGFCIIFMINLIYYFVYWVPKFIF